MWIIEVVVHGIQFFAHITFGVNGPSVVWFKDRTVATTFPSAEDAYDFLSEELANRTNWAELATVGVA